MFIRYNELVSSLTIISTETAMMGGGNPGFPSFGGFIITTNMNQNVTFQPPGGLNPTYFTYTQQSPPSVSYLGGGYLCGM